MELLIHALTSASGGETETTIEVRVWLTNYIPQRTGILVALKFQSCNNYE